MVKKTGIIIQARMASTRLPGKIFLNLKEKPILWHVIKRCEKSRANKIIIATSLNKENNPIEEFCKKNKISCFRWSEKNVLKRYYLCAKEYGLEIIVRITSACPLIDPKLINLCLKNFEKTKYNYYSNVVERSFPRGLDVEVFDFQTLEKTYQKVKNTSQKEHVTIFIYNNPKKFKIGSLIAKGIFNNPTLRLCVDTPKDFKLLNIIYNKFYKKRLVSIEEVLKFLINNPKIAQINLESEK